MNKRKIRKIKRILLLIIIIFCIGYIIYYCFNLIFKKSETNNDEILYTENKEINSNIVEEFFMEKMSLDDYKNTINKEEKYVKSTSSYKSIKYNFDKPLSYNDLTDIFKNLNNSNIVKLEEIGISIDDRTIYSIEIGEGNKITMFEAGIHAAEAANPLFITKYIIDLVNNYENNDKETIDFLNEYKIIVIPVVNPDGYDAYFFGSNKIKNGITKDAKAEELRLYKGNANGVDINRNFPTQTSGLYYNDLHYTVSLEPTFDSLSYFPGTTVASEKETRALMYIQEKWINSITKYISLHSQGRVIYNGGPYLPDKINENSNTLAEIVSNINGYWALDYTYEESGLGNDGTSTEYVEELASGLIFSTETGRLSTTKYREKLNTTKYDIGIIVIETLDDYTKDLNIIKNEYYEYKLEDVFNSLIRK